MRRRFIKIAKEIATQRNCSAIATGESLGQVASQTIESMQVIMMMIQLAMKRLFYIKISRIKVMGVRYVN